MIYKIDDIQLLPFNYNRLSENEMINYSKWFNNPDTNKFNSHARFPFWGGKLPDGDVVWKIKTVEKKYKNVTMTARCPDGHTLNYIGNVGLHSIDYLNRSAEVAIIIGNKDCHGQGIGYKAIKKVIEHGFDQLNLNRIWLGTSSKNKAMIKIAEKVGMQKEGVQRQALWKSGKYHDIENWAVLRGGLSMALSVGEMKVILEQVDDDFTIKIRNPENHWLHDLRDDNEITLDINDPKNKEIIFESYDSGGGD